VQTYSFLVKYELLKEVVKSKALCDFVKMGNTANLVIEFHKSDITGVENMDVVAKKVEKKLAKCGVEIFDLDPWWA
jgi:hypothetical protein